jgi:hypothetical protein
MRTLMIVSIGAEAGNKAISDGSLPKIIEAFLAKYNPESAHFTVNNGDRTMYAVFDMKEASDMPSIAEPFYTQLNAKIELTPVMNGEELKRGLSALSQS